MKWYKLAFLFLLSIIFILTACWSPWLNDSTTRSLAVNHFIEFNSSIQDGCGIICEDCGAQENVHWVPFGRKVTIDYNCGGPIDPATLPKNSQVTAAVSFIGTVTLEEFEE